MKHSYNIQGDEGEHEHEMMMGSICGGEDEHRDKEGWIAVEYRAEIRNQ